METKQEKKEYVKVLRGIFESNFDFEEITKNCYLMKLQPGGSSSENVEKFERACIDKGFAALGWQDGENGNEKGKSYDKASGYINSMNPGDYIITRVRFDSNYYIGKVESVAERGTLEENGGERWMIKVKWTRKNQIDMPSEIVGMFLQRHQATIRKVANCEKRYRFIKHCENLLNKKISKIPINSSNFTQCLSPDELEDLVTCYIQNQVYFKAKGFFTLTSSCKNSTQKYECFFVNKDGKYITTQVKNRQALDIDKYITDVKKDENNDEEVYEKIYLFSGIGAYRNIEKKNENEYKNIEIIDRKDLWNTLQETKTVFSKQLRFYEERDVSDINVDKLEKLMDGFEPKAGKQHYTAGSVHRYWLELVEIPELEEIDETNIEDDLEEKTKKQNIKESPNINVEKNSNVLNVWFDKNVYYSAIYNKFLVFK